MRILLTEFWFLSLWKSHILVEENLFSSYNDFKHFNCEQNTKNLSGDEIALEQLKLIQEGEKNMWTQVWKDHCFSSFMVSGSAAKVCFLLIITNFQQANDRTE